MYVKVALYILVVQTAISRSHAALKLTHYGFTVTGEWFSQLCRRKVLSLDFYRQEAGHAPEAVALEELVEIEVRLVALVLAVGAGVGVLDGRLGAGLARLAGLILALGLQLVLLGYRRVRGNGCDRVVHRRWRAATW